MEEERVTGRLLSAIRLMGDMALIEARKNRYRI